MKVTSLFVVSTCHTIASPQDSSHHKQQKTIADKKRSLHRSTSTARDRTPHRMYLEAPPHTPTDQSDIEVVELHDGEPVPPETD